jgi:hypothetical protein
MKKFIIITVFILIPFNDQLCSQIDLVTQKTSNSYYREYYDKNVLVKNTINCKYRVFGIDEFGTLINVLLKETINEKIYSDREGSESNTKIELFKGKDYNDIIWTIEDEGDKTNQIIDFIGIIKTGCCGSENYYNYYNIDTGKKLFTSSGNISSIELMNAGGPKRRLSYLCNCTEYNIPESIEFPNLLGILNYANDYLIREKLLLLGNFDGMPYTPRISFIDNKGKESIGLFLLPNNDHKKDYTAFNDFIIKLCFGDSYTVLIPVIDDKLQIKKLVLPKGIEIILSKFRSETDYLFSNSFSRLELKNKKELSLLRNEIFARHGCSFNNIELRDFFRQQSWYREIPGHQINNSELTESEKNLLEIIMGFEKR